jgi:signal peptidase I
MVTKRQGATEFVKGMQEELFEKAGEGWFRVISGSMSPLIKIYERILVKKVDLSGIKQGDIVLFKSHDALVTHRVMKIIKNNGKNLILQKGDAGLKVGLIPIESIVGKVVLVDKRGKFLNLESRWIKVINHFIGMNHFIAFKFSNKIVSFKQRIRDKPGYIFLRAIYHLFSKSARFMYSMMWRLLAKTS